MPRIRYRPLEGAHRIRVVEIEAATDDIVDTLPPVSLKHIDLGSTETFSALSYVWGDTIGREPLICDDVSIEITKNFAQALRHIQSRNDHPQSIWIDAICINQNDVVERNQQVSLMSDIYGTAKEVLVWLGPDDENIANECFLLVELIIDLLTKNINDENWDLENWIEFPVETHALERLVPLFKNQYFTRTWTIQEAGLTEEAFALWGTGRVSFARICTVAMLYLKCCREQAEELGVLHELEMITSLYRTYMPSAGTKRFPYVLHDGRAFRASDPRDKVFAFLSHPAALSDSNDFAFSRKDKKHSEMLGDTTIRMRNFALLLSPGPRAQSQELEFARTLTKDMHHEMRPPSPNYLSSRNILNMDSSRWRALHRYHPGREAIFKPDYDSSLVTVYHDLAVRLIERFGSLEILSYVQHESPLPPTGPDFPSWVPRWDVLTDQSIIGRVDCDHFASANRRPIIVSTTDPNEIIVRGIFFDRVALHTITLTRQDFTDYSKTSPVFSMASHCQVDKDPLPPYPQLVNMVMSSNDRLRAYQKTWTAGYSPVASGDSPDFLAYQEEFLRRKSATLTEHEYMLLLSLVERRQGKGDADRFAKAAAEVCHGRKFFITKSGFFGIGPSGVDQEDTVAVLLGHDVPVILREKDKFRKHAEGHVLLGDCYVHGIMSGEVIRNEYSAEDMRNVRLG